MDNNLHSLFSIPVLETELEVSFEIIDYIHSLDYKRTGCNNADISESKNVLEHYLFFKHSQEIDLLVKKFVFEISKFDETKVNLGRVASWVNRHHYSDWAQGHIHANSFISGVWYLETSEKCGDLCVHNPHIGFGLPIDYSKTEYNQYNSQSWTFPSIKNKIYIFPSTLRHSVGRNESMSVRTSIAFNYYARGVLDTEETLIYS